MGILIVSLICSGKKLHKRHKKGLISLYRYLTFRVWKLKQSIITHNCMFVCAELNETAHVGEDDVSSMQQKDK